jgi:hypothetical protein
VTVSANSTVFVGVGTAVVGAGAGGFVIVNGTNGTQFPIVAGIEAAIAVGASGLEAIFAAFAGEEAAEEEEEAELDSTITLSTPTRSLTTSTRSLTTSTRSSTSSSSTSSSATSTPSTYLILPKDGSNRRANANFERKLQGLSQPGSIYDIPLGNGVVFWTANLTTYNASKVQEDSYVSTA